MRERSILFSAPMVRAILAGTKTVTRRLVTSRHILNGGDPGDTGVLSRLEREYGRPIESNQYGVSFDCDGLRGVVSVPMNCPFGEPGDRLWVRETHAFSPTVDDPDDWRDTPGCWEVFYRADGDERPWKTSLDEDDEEIAPPWRPSIFMPRWASRITLEVVSVRVERLHEITEDDAKAEGVDIREPWRMLVNGEPGQVQFFNHRDAFAHLWAAINGGESWRSNPWVWRVEFKRTPKPTDGDHGDA